MRLLLLYPRMPYPPDKGDKIRTYHQFGYLSQRHEVWCACFVDDAAEWRHIGDCARLCAEFEAIPLSRRVGLPRGVVSLARGRSLTEGYLHHRRMKQLVEHWSQRTDFDAVLCFGSGMGQYGLRARASRRCLDLCDLDSLKWQEYAERRKGGLSGRLYGLEAKRVAELERRLEAAFDATTLIAVQDAVRLREQTCSTKIHVVGNGVDTEEQAACGTPASEPVISFVGALDYWPNQDAVCWFSEVVWSELRRRVPRVEWLIVGRNPPRKVRRLGSEPGVVVTGRVPEVVSYLRGTRVVIAPLRMGQGLQNKVLEGMACARPVVATPQAALGIGAGEIPGLSVVRSAHEMVLALESLLLEPGRAENAGAAARAWVCRNFRWSDKLADLERILLGPRMVPTPGEPAEGARQDRAVPLGVHA